MGVTRSLREELTGGRRTRRRKRGRRRRPGILGVRDWVYVCMYGRGVGGGGGGGGGG